MSNFPAPGATGGPELLAASGDGVARLTLNRPQARNALSSSLITALDAALGAAEADPAVRVVVIAAAGPTFCAGHDMYEMRANPGEAAIRALFAQCSALMLRNSTSR